MTNARKARVAIVCSGGGMRCAYSGGALIALAREYGLVEPDLMVASSGSVGSMMYYIAQQYVAIRNIWTDLLATHKFISLRRMRSIMDIDHLVDDVLRGKELLHVDRVDRSPIAYHVPLCDAATGGVRWFTRDDNIDVFTLLRAAKAVPVVYGKQVMIGGRTYVDGELAVTFEECVLRAIALGATQVIAIDNRPNLAVKRFATLVARGVLFRRLDPLPTLHITVPSEVRIVTIRSGRLPAHLLTNDERKLAATFARGYNDTAESAELRTLFESI